MTRTVSYEEVALARLYMEAGLSQRAAARLLGHCHTALRRAMAEDEAHQDPERFLPEAKWRCQCTAVNTGPAPCACGRRPYWAEADDRAREVEQQLEEGL